VTGGSVVAGVVVVVDVVLATVAVVVAVVVVVVVAVVDVVVVVVVAVVLVVVTVVLVVVVARVVEVVDVVLVVVGVVVVVLVVIVVVVVGGIPVHAAFARSPPTSQGLKVALPDTESPVPGPAPDGPLALPHQLQVASASVAERFESPAVLPMIAFRVMWLSSEPAAGAMSMPTAAPVTVLPVTVEPLPAARRRMPVVPPPAALEIELFVMVDAGSLAMPTSRAPVIVLPVIVVPNTCGLT
jgi:hypothetical protein